jgi:hypothetical protein
VGTDAGAQTTIEAVGTIDVVAKRLPPDMTPEECAAARIRKANDIAIVLERSALHLATAVVDQLDDRLAPATRPEIALTFDAHAPTFRAQLRWADGFDANQRAELGSELVAALRDTMSAQILATASHTGTWEPVVTADLVGPSAKRLRRNAIPSGAPWWLIASIAAATILLAGYILTAG